jgi:S1-C subfamily serine protease
LNRCALACSAGVPSASPHGRRRGQGAQGYGSAFCIHSSGWFLTNAHVAQGEITLILDPSLKTEKSYSARVVRSDNEVDLALLHVDGVKNLPTVPLGSDEGLEELMEVVGFGFPFGAAVASGRREHPAISVNVDLATAGVLAVARRLARNRATRPHCDRPRLVPGTQQAWAETFPAQNFR